MGEGTGTVLDVGGPLHLHLPLVAMNRMRRVESGVQVCPSRTRVPSNACATVKPSSSLPRVLTPARACHISS